LTIKNEGGWVQLSPLLNRRATMKNYLTIALLMVCVAVLAQAAINFGLFRPTGARILSTGILSVVISKGEPVIVTDVSGDYFINKLTVPIGDTANFADTVLAVGYLNESGAPPDVRSMTALWWRPAIEADFD
jgi:hypothetical protein